MPLLSDAALASLRAALGVVLVHTCTVTPLIDGPEDAEGNVTRVPGTPATNVPCTYSTATRVVRDDLNTTLVQVPSLTVSATLALPQGTLVSDITDQLGAVLLAGPASVERVLDDTAGLGAALLPSYELRFGAVGG